MGAQAFIQLVSEFFCLFQQPSFLILKHMLNPDWRRLIVQEVMNEVLSSILLCNCPIVLRRDHSKSHLNRWSSCCSYHSAQDRQDGLVNASVGLALRHAVRTNSYWHGSAGILPLSELCKKTLKLISMSNSVKMSLSDQMAKFPLCTTDS